MKRQQRIKVMKDMTKKVRSKGRMDAENRWWVAVLLAADCEKAWLPSRRGRRNHAKMVCSFGKMKKEDEKRKMEELHQQRVNQMIKSAEGSAGLFAQNHEAVNMERRIAGLEERRGGCQAD